MSALRKAVAAPQGIGEFVMLHPAAQLTVPARPHPDAGRIGRVEAADAFNLLVCFRDHPQTGRRMHCILPRAAWLPVEQTRVEAQEADGAVIWRLAS